MNAVFVHGLGQNAESWKSVLACMQGSVEANCPDLAKLLENRKTNYENLYGAFEAYCNAILGQLNLCGLSLGAVLALHYACVHPKKIRSLVLMAPQYKMPKGLLKFQNIIFRLMPESAFRETGLKKADFLSLTNSMAELDFRGYIKDIFCDTLILCGEKDKANRKAALKTREHIPQSALCFVPDAGHEINVENPQRTAQEIEAFWRKLPTV